MELAVLAYLSFFWILPAVKGWLSASGLRIQWRPGGVQRPLRTTDWLVLFVLLSISFASLFGGPLTVHRSLFRTAGVPVGVSADILRRRLQRRGVQGSRVDALLTRLTSQREQLLYARLGAAFEQCEWCSGVHALSFAVYMGPSMVARYTSVCVLIGVSVFAGSGGTHLALADRARIACWSLAPFSLVIAAEIYCLLSPMQGATRFLPHELAHFVYCFGTSVVCLLNAAGVYYCSSGRLHITVALSPTRAVRIVRQSLSSALVSLQAAHKVTQGTNSSSALRKQAHDFWEKQELNRRAFFEHNVSAQRAKEEVRFDVNARRQQLTPLIKYALSNEETTKT